MTQQEFFNRFTYSVRTDKIGGGGFGNVYRAYDNTLHREVAIKVSEVKTTNDGQKTFSLKDEFEALAHVPKHPNIANYEEFYSFESPQGVFDYAVMQYYPGGNLTDAIRQGLTLEQKEVVARQLLEGIGFLHAHQVVHRDLKPGNILIVRHGGKVIPLITDFGLSKAANTGDGSLFSNSFGGGTQRYSSPEQLQGKSLRFNTDLWSFGAILYELFTGEQLFTASSGAADTAAAELEIYNKIIHGDVRALYGLPEKWRRVAERCLVVNPEQRAKSVDELRTMVDIQGAFSHNAGGSVPTPPIDSEETVVGGVAAMGVKDEETVADRPAPTTHAAATENPKAQPRSRKRKVWPWLLVAVAAVVVAIILLVRGCDGGVKTGNKEAPKSVAGDTVENIVEDTPVVKDIDGNEYKIVKIGEQTWMAENLRTTHYSDGTPIQKGWKRSISTGYWTYPNGDSTNTDSYGLLYNWKAVMRNSTSSNRNPSGVQGICPDGWHVPSSKEWDQLSNYLSGDSQYTCNGEKEKIAKALASTYGWHESANACAVGYNMEENNITGFSALPAGEYYGEYEGYGFGAFFSCTTEGNSEFINSRSISNNGGDFYKNYIIYCKRNYLSVRCVMDDSNE